MTPIYATLIVIAVMLGSFVMLELLGTRKYRIVCIDVSMNQNECYYTLHFSTFGVLWHKREYEDREYADDKTIRVYIPMRFESQQACRDFIKSRFHQQKPKRVATVLECGLTTKVLP
jgi:hypothetical protein